MFGGRKFNSSTLCKQPSGQPPTSWDFLQVFSSIYTTFVSSFSVFQFSRAVLNTITLKKREFFAFSPFFHFVQESGEMVVVVADFGLARIVRDRPMTPMNRISATLPPSPGRKPLHLTGNRPPPPKKR